MTSAVAQARAVAQISQASSAATGTLSKSGFLTGEGGFDILGPCRAAKDEDDEDSEEEFRPVIQASTADLQKYWLRMCVYSGENLVKDSSQVVVDIGEGTPEAQSISGPIAAKSTRPVWEFQFEREIEISGEPPALEIKVLGKSLLTRSIGAAALVLPKQPTSGPQRVWLKLRNVPSDFPGFDPPKSKIQVVWQLSTSTRGEPDLARVAEMDDMATEVQRFYINVRLLRVKLRAAQDPPVPLRVKVALAKKQRTTDSTGKDQTKVTTIRSNMSDAVMLKTSHDPDHTDATPGHLPRVSEAGGDAGPQPEACWAVWGKQGWMLEPIVVRESRVNLFSHVLQLTVQLKEEKFLSLGSWEESIGNLADAIDACAHTLRFDAEVHSMRGGVICGFARVEVDFHDGTPHRPPPPSIDDVEGPPPALRATSTTSSGLSIRQKPMKQVVPVPIRRGQLPDALARMGRKVKYYCSIWVTGLPMEGMGNVCDPYVRVTMGSSRAETERLVDRSDDILFSNPVVVTSLEEDTKARIEVWNSNTFALPIGIGNFGTDQLIGEAMIYDVEPDKLFWRHLYGGALQPPRPEQAMQMTKGALSPASTYHGTVVVQFGSKPRIPAEFVTRTQTAAAPHTVKVRLYQGVYLHHYAGKAVTVLFQIAGCHLRVHPPRPRDQANGWDKNPYILSFPGIVSKKGVLNLIEDGSKVLSFKDMIFGGSDPPQSAWVQRSTPEDVWFNPTIGEGPTHAYCYIVSGGEEEQAPQVFGRFRLSSGDEQALENPRWKRMRFDDSVVLKPPATFPSDLAGFLLGSVVVLPSSGGMSRDADTPLAALPAPASPSAAIVPRDTSADDTMFTNNSTQAKLLPRTSRPRSVMCRPCAGESFIHVASTGEGVMTELAKAPGTMYCHIDVLAARNLAATDADGLTDPVYEIQVGSKKMRTSNVTAKSLNPTFMQRVCIPIEVGSNLELPPVVFKMLDYDTAIEGGGRVTKALTTLAGAMGDLGATIMGGELMEVGTVVVKEAQELDRHELCGPGPEPLDLNNKHRAMWHALDRPARTDFDPTEEGGCDPSWGSRPRVLLAVGFSNRMEVSGCTWKQAPHGEGMVAPLETGPNNKMHFKINVNLLGVRSLNDKGFELSVSSFWTETSPYQCPYEDSNFDEDSLENMDKLGLEILSLLDVKDSGKEGASVVKTKTIKKGVSSLPPMDVRDFCGSRIAAPVYSIPIIPYLQTSSVNSPSSKKLRSQKSSLAKAHAPEGEASPFVLMPDVVFQLKRGESVHASLSIPLPQTTAKLFSETAVEEAKAAEESGEVVKADRIRNAVVQEDAYTVSVDCFASTDGFVKWNKDVMMGRGLSQPHVFSIYGESLDGHSGSGKEMPLPVANHFFNPGDWMSGSNDAAKWVDEPFDERVSPVLRCAELVGGQWKSTRKTSQKGFDGTQPLSPQQLYRGYRPFGSAAICALQNAPKDGCLPAHGDPDGTLAKITTMALRNRAFAGGWRAMSHMHAPEPIDFLEATRGKFSCKAECPDATEHLELNLHTFMRPVGHIIDPADRDSRLLARLRVCLPEAQGQQSDAVKKEEQNLSFAIVKFEKPGIVVWTPPEDAYEFTSRHRILFIVELLDGTNDLVLVLVPSFDLRFHYETSWYLKKTLGIRYRELQNRIERDAAEKAKEKVEARASVLVADEAKGEAKAEPKDPEEGGNIMEIDEAEREDVDADFAPVNLSDGYSRTIYVKKHAFVCRLVKRSKGLNFDRTQTRNWYRTKFHRMFQEIDDLPPDKEDDAGHVRDFFLKHFMNLRQPLYEGEESKETGLIKGHIHITKADVDAEVGGPRAKRASPSLQRPLGNLWVKRSVTLNLYILTARNLKLYGIAKNSFKPYLKVDIHGTDNSLTTEPLERLPAQAGSINFYTHFSASITIPGPAMLRVQIFNSRPLLKDHMVGECCIDVEDRMLSMVHGHVREDVNMKLKGSTLNPKSRFKIANPPRGPRSMHPANREWKAPVAVKIARPEDGGTTMSLYPKLPPQAQSPIETLDLRREDEDTATEISVGALRFWLDVTPSDERYVEAQLQDTSQYDFRIVVTIWEVWNISIFRDYGERNDVYVKVTLRLTDATGRTDTQEWKTSIHKWAHSEASFNELKSFSVKAPVVSCTLHLKLLDDDIISHDDAIYDSKVVALDHMLMLACTNFRDGRDVLGVNHEEVIFDSWPKSKEDKLKDTLKGRERRCLKRCINICCFCCLRRARRHAPTPARMNMDIQIIPEVEAVAQNIKDGVVLPPKNRMTWETMVQNPKRFFVAFFGPTCVRRTMFTTCIVLIMVVLLAVVGLAFLSLGSVASINDIVE